VAFDEAVREGLGAAAAAHGVVPQVAVVFQAETPQRVKLALPGLDVGPFDVPAVARQERHFSASPERPAGAPVWGDGIYSETFLILSLLETAEGMSLVARGVFDPGPMRSLLADFQSLLEQVVADPDGPVSRPLPVCAGDVLELRGFRAGRSRLEAALATCPGVADVTLSVGEDACLVAHVVPEAAGTPTLADIRHALWSSLPGAPWPAEADLPRPATDPTVDLLAAMWGEISGRPARPGSIYWQDFSFLQVLAEARDAGLAITDEHVVRCRTPEMLAAALRLS
jgi:hypothetical protein